MKNLFDEIAPFNGQHNPLRGGWDDEQLEVMRKGLGLTGPGSLSIAFAACSLVAEQCTTTRPLRYPRSQSNYSYFEAYQGDPMMTYRRVVPAIDWLIANGYAEGHKGIWWLGKQSLARGGDGDLAEAETAVDRLAAAPTDDLWAARDIMLLRLRALLARALGDEAGYRDYRDRYRAMANSLGYEGHMKWAEAMP